MKDANVLKVNNFGKRYKDWAEVVGKINNKIEQQKPNQDPYKQMTLENEEIV